jgi:hypothetical protein
MGHDLSRTLAALTGISSRGAKDPDRPTTRPAYEKTWKDPTETEMKSAKVTKTTQSVRREAQNLEVRYGEIGISAVAAAMRYQGDAKTPALVPAESQPERWLEDAVPEFAA